MRVRSPCVVHPLLLLEPFVKQIVARVILSLDQPLKTIVADSPSSSHSAGGAPPPPSQSGPYSVVVGLPHLRRSPRPHPGGDLPRWFAPSPSGAAPPLLPVRWQWFAPVPPPLDSCRPPFLPFGGGSPSKPFDRIFCLFFTSRWVVFVIFVVS